jgi:hypothetical protein
VQDDLKELIESLQSHHVEFLIVGAHALAAYGRPRYTQDIDIFLRRSHENAIALVAAFSHFGIPISIEAALNLMSQDRQMIVLGRKPSSVDLLNFLDGVEFEEAWRNKTKGQVFGVETWIIGKSDFIKTKIATGIPKDLLDLELMKEISND